MATKLWPVFAGCPITCIYQGKAQYPRAESRMAVIRSTENGTDFQVVAVVTNVNQAVNEGSDGVEHM